MSKGIWVLTREHNDYDQHGKYFETVFSKQPSLQDLAEYFHGEGTDLCLGNIMGTVAFLEHLRTGGGRRGVEDVWYNLDFVSFANKEHQS